MRKGEILLRYIEANPGTGATDAFRACGFPIGGVGNPNYEALKRLVRRKLVVTDKHRGRVFLYPYIPEHHELHQDNSHGVYE